MLQMLGLLAVLDKTQQPSSSISVQVVEVLAAAADFELLVRINFYKYQKLCHIIYWASLGSCAKLSFTTNY